MRLHPLSVVARGAGLATSGAFFGVVLAGVVPAVGLPVEVSVLLPILGALAGIGAAVARYLAFDYELSDDRLVVRSGVLARRHREIPLGRVQSVDVSQPLLARPFGLAAVNVETAGGGSTEAALAYVTVAEARRLQDALRGGEGTSAGAEATGEPAGDVLFRLPGRDLGVLGLVSFRWGTVPALALGAPVAGTVLTSLLLDVLESFESGLVAALAALAVGLGAIALLAGVAWAVSSVTTIVRYYGFTLRRVGDELRYERGLVERYSGTIPLDKVQALTVEENVLMRRLGYAALVVETAGYAGESGGGEGGSRAPSAVPLAGREEVLALVDSLAGVDELSVTRPPERARRRYGVRYAILLVALAGLLGAAYWATGVPRSWFGPLLALPLAPVAGRLKWRHRGHRVDDSRLLAREGFWRRTTRIVPHFRLQTVIERRTVFQRRWGLASVTGDTASSAGFLGGDATAHDLDRGDARELHWTLRERLRAALRRRRTARRSRAIGLLDEEPGTDGDDGPGTDRATTADAPGDATDGEGQVTDGEERTADVEGETAGGEKRTADDESGGGEERATDGEGGAADDDRRGDGEGGVADDDRSGDEEGGATDGEGRRANDERFPDG